MVTLISGSNDSLDSFYFSFFPNLNQSHPDLSFILKLMLVLNHDQASVERGFSFKNVTLKDNISELPLDSKRLIIDHMLFNDLRPETIELSPSLLVAFKSTRRKYEASKTCNEKRSRKKMKKRILPTSLVFRLTN